MKGLSSKPWTLFEITVVALFYFAVLLLLDRGLSAKESPDIKFETYVWQNPAPNEPSFRGDDAYQPLALKISGDIEEQTGVKLEKIVEQGGEVIFNFFYTGVNPLVTNQCDLVEVIITTSEGKIIEDYLLRFTNDKISFSQRDDTPT